MLTDQNRLKRYLNLLQYLEGELITLSELAHHIVDHVASNEEFDLFATLMELVPTPVKDQIVAFLSELSKDDFDRFIVGIGGTSSSEESTMRERLRQKKNYRRLGVMAGITGPSETREA